MSQRFSKWIRNLMNSEKAMILLLLIELMNVCVILMQTYSKATSVLLTSLAIINMITSLAFTLYGLALFKFLARIVDREKKTDILLNALALSSMGAVVMSKSAKGLTSLLNSEKVINDFFYSLLGKDFHYYFAFIGIGLMIASLIIVKKKLN